MSSFHCFDCAYYNGEKGYCELHLKYCGPDHWCPDCKPLGQHYYRRESYEDKCCSNCWYRNSDGYCRKLSKYVDGNDSCPYFTF